MQELLNRHGSECITDMAYIKTTNNKALNVFRGCFFKNKYVHVQPFHIELQIKTDKQTTLFLEKTLTINLQYNKNTTTMYYIPIEKEKIPHGLTLKTLLENTQKEMGPYFAHYSIFCNCQQFVKTVIKSNGISNEIPFICQDFKEMIMPCFLPIAHLINGLLFILATIIKTYSSLYHQMIPSESSQLV